MEFGKTSFFMSKFKKCASELTRYMKITSNNILEKL